jgi:drug/metabolite transporter (DMT)-like permease
MNVKQLAELVLLAALWGASFLFMRMGAPEFGPVSLIFIRVCIAALFLSPIFWVYRKKISLRTQWRLYLVVGMFNSALPFCLLAYTSLSVTAGTTSILNATTPMWTALIAYFWLKERLGFSRIAGLFIGMFGVGVLVWGETLFKPGGTGLAVIAGLIATSAYGYAANYARQNAKQIPPWVVAASSQLTAAILLLPFGVWCWPAQAVSTNAWLAVLGLGIGCTAVAFVLYFHLLATLGSTKTVAVAFLIPLFALLWGHVWLNEVITLQTILGGCIVVLGTALATSFVRIGRDEKKESV